MRVSDKKKETKFTKSEGVGNPRDFLSLTFTQFMQKSFCVSKKKNGD